MTSRFFFNLRSLSTFIVLAPMFIIGCKSTGPQSSLRGEPGTDRSVTIEPSFFPIEGPTDVIFQNRTITRNYYFGAEALNQALFGSSTNGDFQSNWLHYGIWGSLRVGESLDGTDIQTAYTAKDLAFSSLESTLAWLPQGMRDEYVSSLRRDQNTIQTLTKIMQQSLGGGNRRVADEIMGISDRYIRTLGCETSFNESSLQKFLDTFEYSLPRDASMSDIWSTLLADIPNLSAGKTHRFGQDALARAYEAYHRAKFESAPSIRTQMMHYGNVLIAIHEQFVLQTYIAGAMGVLDPAGPLGKKVATIFTMDIGVPGNGFKGISRSGEGLVRYPLRSGFPAKGFSPSLKVYTWEPLVELAQVTGLDTNSGRGASDWTDYKSRVYLIGGMLRTLHDNPRVRSFPYAGPHQEPKMTCP